MAFSAGVWTASALNSVKVAANKMFNSEVWNKQWSLPNMVWNDLITNQTLNATDPAVMDLQDGTTCRAVTVHWIQDKATPATTDCGTAYAGDNTDCSFTGTELGSDSKSYTTACLEVSRRRVLKSNCKDEISYNEKTATALMNIKKELELELEQRLISFIEGAKKTNPLTSAEWTGTIAGDTWTFTPAEIQESLIAELLEAAEILRMVNPVLVSGRAWYQNKIIADATVGTTSNIFSLLGSDKGFPSTHDIVNLDTLAGGAGDQYFYLVDLATIGFIPEARYSNTAPMSDVANLSYWRDSLMNLQWANNGQAQAIPIDMRRLVQCTGQSDYAYDYEGKASGAFVEAPANDGSNYPNVIKCVVNVTP